MIATKVGPWRDALGAWQGMARRDQLRGQVEENLRQLGRDHLDLVNLPGLSRCSRGRGRTVPHCLVRYRAKQGAWPLGVQ